MTLLPRPSSRYKLLENLHLWSKNVLSANFAAIPKLYLFHNRSEFQRTEDDSAGIGVQQYQNIL